MRFIQALHIHLILLNQDERGDNENLGRLLLLALVLIPLIILIAFFGAEIFEAAQEQWEEVMDSGLG